jgi:16S rRNA (uracil1498-N3)-methyltransferase
MLKRVQHDKKGKYVYKDVMRLTRLYIPDAEFAAGLAIHLNDDQSHYLLRVLRMEAGQEVVVFNASCGAWIGPLAVTGKKGAVALVAQIQKPQPVSDIWLVASPLKKEAWDFVIEKATELGVAALRPALMEFTQNTRVNEERARANLIEAAQQCERTDVPELFTVEKLGEILRHWDRSRILYVALERSDAQPAMQVFDKTKPGAILIGPEGGFSPHEKELFLKYDFIKPVSLGPLVLRAETAAIAAFALWAA